MIPKIIHYCWFGSKSPSRVVRKCIATWKKHLPDYKFMLWNETNSPMEHPYVKSAYAAKKYAFVADYVRFWALYNYGGIYLDTDMYVIKSFDDLLDDEFFCAWETATEFTQSPSVNNCENPTTHRGGAGCSPTVSCGALGACALGACAKKVLEKYDTLVFENNAIEQLIITKVITPIINDSVGVTIYPFDFFYPFPYEQREQKNFLSYATKNTYAIHLWDLSWRSNYSKILSGFYKKTKKIIPFWLKRSYWSKNINR